MIPHRTLIKYAEDIGVEIKWGHKLTHLEQSEDNVRAVFANGETSIGSFMVGCDGLHSNTRMELFGDQKADYTSLTQVRYENGVCNYQFF